MKWFTFPGGIHPPEKKELSEKSSIEVMPLPDQVIIPLHQHMGAPAKPVVKKGDLVKRGTLLGEAQGFISSNVHSSVAGKIKDITYFDHSKFGRSMGVIIDVNKENDDWDPQIKPVENPDTLTPEQIIEMVKNAGIVGMGGATFPTQVKLAPPPGKDYEYFILNGAECEPFLTADQRLLIEQPERIFKGCQLILKACKAQKGIVAIESNKPEAIKIWTKLLENQNNFQLKVLKTKYPQGAEKQLIYALLNREVPSGGLPVEVHALVQNVGTAAAIHDVIYHGYPLVERITTVTGAVKQRKNLKLRIGTLVSDIIKYCGGYLGEPGKIIFGGPMMGDSQRTDYTPISKGTSGIVVQNKQQVSRKQHLNCIRCGKCVTVCPMNLLPFEIAIRVENDYIDHAQSLNAMDCIECGSCSYVCPSNRELVQLIRLGKNKITAKRKRGA